jgi:hypothetical protein
MIEGKLYFDDGTEYNPDLYPKPNLCLVCKKNADPNEEMLCILNRMDQLDNNDFKCFAFEEDKEK